MMMFEMMFLFFSAALEETKQVQKWGNGKSGAILWFCAKLKPAAKFSFGISHKRWNENFFTPATLVAVWYNIFKTTKTTTTTFYLGTSRGKLSQTSDGTFLHCCRGSVRHCCIWHWQWVHCIAHKRTQQRTDLLRDIVAFLTRNISAFLFRNSFTGRCRSAIPGSVRWSSRLWMTMKVGS